MEVLREAKHVHPDAWWWVKADGCDIVSGLKESVKKEWSGDVDLNDGAVRELHQEYTESLRFLGAVGVGARRVHRVLKMDLEHLQENLQTYLAYLSSSKILTITLCPSSVMVAIIGLVRMSDEYILGKDC